MLCVACEGIFNTVDVFLEPGVENMAFYSYFFVMARPELSIVSLFVLWLVLVRSGWAFVFVVSLVLLCFLPWRVSL